MKKIVLSLLILISFYVGNAQQATVIDSKSLTVPRYNDLAAITANVTSPQTGTMVYNIATQSNWIYNGSAWKDAVSNGTSQWITSGNNINYSTGNVGIGNFSPNAPLQFSNALGNRKLVFYDNNNNDHTFYGFGINSGTLRYQVDAVAADHVFFAGVNSSSSNELFRIKGNGNVGIGVSNPDYSLVTKGRIRIRDSGGGESSGIWFNNNGNSALNTFIGIDPSNNFGIFSQNLLKNTVTANMTTGGLRVEGPDFPSPSARTLSLGGFGRVDADAPGIAGGRFSILENGNVGINNNNPSEKLEINGNIKINNGAIRFGNPALQSNNISSFNGYLFLNGGSASGGNGVWINNTGNSISGVKFNATGSLGLNDNEGTMNQVLTSNGPGSQIAWKSASQIIQSFSLPEVTFVVPNNNENVIPGASFSVSVPVAGKLIIWSNFTNRFSCVNPLDHCYLVWTLHTMFNGIEIKASRIQSTIAYSLTTNALYNEHAIAPIVINISAGNHTISFKETLSSITPGPTVMVSSYAQFIPN